MADDTRSAKPPAKPKPDHSALETDAANFWLARISIAVIAGLQLLIVNTNSTFGPRWLAPAVEIAMLIPLSIATSWTRDQARGPKDDHNLHKVGRYRRTVRLFALLLTCAVMLVNLLAFAFVIRELLQGSKGPSGKSLLIDAMNIWFTNILIFALFFWNIDNNSPSSRGLDPDAPPDFLFPQMTGVGDKDPDWTPGFVDYLYLSFTNATAFSPTDTMPLSPRSKLLMALEAMVSLLTVGLVAARAVNILN